MNTSYIVQTRKVRLREVQDSFRVMHTAQVAVLADTFRVQGDPHSCTVHRSSRTAAAPRTVVCSQRTLPTPSSGYRATTNLPNRAFVELQPWK